VKDTLTQAKTVSDSFELFDYTRPESGAVHTSFCHGNFGTATGVKLQISPDTKEVPDASSRWVDVTGGVHSTVGTSFNFQGKCRKFRWALDGTADATTNVTVEMV